MKFRFGIICLLLLIQIITLTSKDKNIEQNIIKTNYPISKDIFIDRAKIVNSKLNYKKTFYGDNNLRIIHSDSTEITEINYIPNTYDDSVSASFLSYNYLKTYTLKPKKVYNAFRTNIIYQAYDQEIYGKESQFYGLPYHLDKSYSKFITLNIISPGFGFYYLFHDHNIKNGKGVALFSSLFLLPDIYIINQFYTGGINDIKGGKFIGISSLIGYRYLISLFWKSQTKERTRLNNSGYHITRTW